jgi:hypothetical protein
MKKPIQCCKVTSENPGGDGRMRAPLPTGERPTAHGWHRSNTLIGVMEPTPADFQNGMAVKTDASGGSNFFD